MTATNAATQGGHHVGLTVPNLQHTQQFFTDILDFQLLGEKPDYPAAFVSDGYTMITLWQQHNSDGAQPFNRHHHVRLHHLALRVANFDTLDQLYQQLATTPDVEIEFAPEALGTSPNRHMMTRIPGGIRVEFISMG